jgi:hypothetical protein
MILNKALDICKEFYWFKAVSAKCMDDSRSASQEFHVFEGNRTTHSALS